MSCIEQAFCRSRLWRSFEERTVLPWVLSGRTVHGTVLEIGGGDGSIASTVLRAAPDVTLTMTDYDERMLEAARRRLAPFEDRVTIEQADATDLRYADDSFDTVLTFIMLHHVIKWELALAEAVRVLRPGGVMFGYDLTNTPLTRVTHTLDRSQARPMRLSELSDHAQRLPVDVDIGEIWHGLVIRFALTKQSRATHDETNDETRTTVA
jgi:2-polyprenyl-3-methyl-5-hydroxy-6-metoxy-1,4-benzoquinol methylase